MMKVLKSLLSYPARILGVVFMAWSLCDSEFRNSLYRLTWDKQRMEKFRLKQLKDLMQYAFDHSEFYKNLYTNAGLTPDDLHTLDDIQKFPIVTKSQLRSAINDKTIFTKHDMPAGTISVKTTGSTGDPLTLYFDKSAVQGRKVNGMRSLWLMGAFPYKKFCFIWRSKRISFGQRLRGHIGLLHYVPVVNVTDTRKAAFGSAEMKQTVKGIADFNPQVVRGYTSALHVIAQIAKKYSIQLRAQCVIASAEYLPPVWKKDMEEVFGCPVYNLYGGTEAGTVAASLQGRSELTVFHDFYCAEIVDQQNKHVPTGESGRILVSDYNCLYMPLIRYEIGDVAEQGSNEGLFPLWNEVQGRINDVFVLPGGKIFFSHNWHVYFENLSSISRFKIIQRSVDLIDIYLETIQPGMKWDSQLGTLKEAIQNALGSDVTVNYYLVDTLDLDKGEKFRGLRSEIDIATIIKNL